MRDVRAIAKSPHPLASAADAKVHDYLVNRLKEFGLAPEIETAIVAAKSRVGPETFATVHNIIAKLPGAASTGAVMMVAHYDSVPSGPGAADDASSVAALLETVRALRTAPPLRNDIIVLLTDGEELGLLGARAFVENYSGLRGIRVVLNFDMRGDYGPVLMLQTSPDNTWMIRALAKTRYPRANSLAASIYKRMPNESDFSVFLHRDLAGMNFAAIRGLVRYHTRLDNVTNLDPRSVQNQGSYALALARDFGAMDLRAAHRGDSVFFTLGRLFHYPAGLALPLAIITALIVIGALTAGNRLGRMPPLGLTFGALIFIGALVIAIIEGEIVSALMRWICAAEMLPSGTTYGGFWFALASTFIVIASLLAFYLWMRRYVSRANLGGGALAILAIIALVAGADFLSGSYLIAWPVLFAAFAIHYRWTRLGGDDPLFSIFAALAALIPCTILIAPGLFTNAEGTRGAMLLGVIMIALLFGFYIPYTDLLTERHERSVSVVLAIAAVLCFLGGIGASQFSKAHPRPDSIFYLLDSDSGKATWESLDRAPDPFTAQFFQNHVRRGSLAIVTGMSEPALKEAPLQAKFNHAALFSSLSDGATIEGDAPAAELAPPTLEVIGDTSTAGLRTLRLHIASARGAPIIWIAIPRAVTVLSSSIDDKSSDAGPIPGYTAWVWGVSQAGFDFTLTTRYPDLFPVTIIDQTDGLPALTAMKIHPRGPAQMPSPDLFFDSATLVKRTFIPGAQMTTPNA